MAAKEPENMQLQRDVSVGLDRLGDICLRAGRAPEALERFEAGMVIARQIAAKDAASAAAQHDLSAGLAKLGNTYLALERAADAEAAYRDGLDIARRLAAADPLNTEVQRSVSVMQCKVGGAQLLQGKMDEATQAFDAAIAVASRLAESDPGSVQAQRDLAVCYHRAMLGFQQSGNLERRREASQHAVAGFERGSPGHVRRSRLPARSRQRVDPGLRRVLCVFRSVTGRLADACSPGPSNLWLCRTSRTPFISKPWPPTSFSAATYLCAVASTEKALQAVTDGPVAAETRAKLNEQLDGVP